MSDPDDQESADDQDNLEPEDDQDSDSGSDNSAPPKDESSAEGDKKRIDDLMSKWQTAQAENDKLKKQVARLKAPKPSDKKSADDPNDANAEFTEFIRENTRKTIFDSDPRLAKYGLKPDVIAGENLAEMKESFERHLKLVTSVETQARNDALAEHGLEPELTTGAGDEEGKSFSSMSDKEFAEFLAKRDAQL